MSEQEEAALSSASKEWAAALGRVPSGLFVVTVAKGDAETGMLASWVQQCSFEPPQVSVAVRRDRPVHDWLTPGARFSVNILAEGPSPLKSHFGKGFRPDEPAFTGLNVERPGGAAPVLADALGYLDCEVAGRFSAGDHDLILGRILAGRLFGDARPHVHVRKNGLNY